MNQIHLDIQRVILADCITNSFDIGRIELVCKSWKNLSRSRTTIRHDGKTMLPNNIEQLYPNLESYTGSIDSLRNVIPTVNCRLSKLDLVGSKHNLASFFYLIRCYYNVELEDKLTVNLHLLDAPRRTMRFADQTIRTLRGDEYVYYINLIGEKARVVVRTDEPLVNMPATEMTVTLIPTVTFNDTVIDGIIAIFPSCLFKKLTIKGSKTMIDQFKEKVKIIPDNITLIDSPRD